MPCMAHPCDGVVHDLLATSCHSRLVFNPNARDLGALCETVAIGVRGANGMAMGWMCTQPLRAVTLLLE